MKHFYYDFALRFDTAENAQKAQTFYTNELRPKIGGKFTIMKDKVGIMSIRDEYQTVLDFYPYGLERFIVIDMDHGPKKDENGLDIFDFLTDTNTADSVKSDYLNENIVEYLINGINQHPYEHQKDEIPAVIKRYQDSDDLNDLFDMLSVNVPDLDI